MLIHVPDHFSSRFKFDFAKNPTSATDRISLRLSLSGCIFGLLLLFLGIFELLSFLKNSPESNGRLLTVELFAVLITLLALGIVISSILSIIRCKKFLFDGRNFTITYRPAIGLTHTFSEPLDNYIGVRLRVLFTQAGLFNKNRYIIDLYHSDKNKIVPLYITTKNKNIRKIWENYARTFKLPALSIGDRGLVRREVQDLTKSIIELNTEGKLPPIASGKFPAPDSLKITEKKTATIVEPKGIYWDTFSTLFLLIAVAAVILLTAGGVYLTLIGTTLPLKYWGAGAILLLGILYFTAKLFTSSLLKIEKNNITVCEIFLGSEVKEKSLSTQKIENIELNYNPTIDRYSLTIISNDSLINFGSRLPSNDLLWLKDFLIRKLIGN